MKLILILIAINQFLLLNTSANQGIKKTNYDNIIIDLNEKLYNLNRLQLGNLQERIQTNINNNAEVEDNPEAKKEAMGLVKELQDNYKLLQDELIKLTQQIDSNSLDVTDSKLKIDLLEEQIMKLYEKIDTTIRQDDQRLNKFYDLIKNLVKTYKEMINNLLEKINQLDFINVQRETENENMIIEAMYVENYELAAVKLFLIHDENRLVELIKRAYREFKSIDPMLLLAKTVRSIEKRFVIYRTVYYYILDETNNAKPDGCTIVKLQEAFLNYVIKLIPQYDFKYQDIYFFREYLERSVNEFTYPEMVDKYGSDKIISRIFDNSFDIFTNDLRLIVTVDYAIKEPHNNKGPISCSIVVI